MTMVPAKLTQTQRPDRRYLIVIAAIIAVGLATVVHGYWPGVMIDDARWQYQQAVDNAYEDWHPPLMAWIWRRLMLLQPGPAPMLVVQLSLYWAGLTPDRSLGLSPARSPARRRGGPRRLVARLTCPYRNGDEGLPDGRGACLRNRTDPVGARGSPHAGNEPHYQVAALAALMFAAALRFNAFLACVPLALAAVPRPFTRTVRPDDRDGNRSNGGVHGDRACDI